MHLLWLLFYFGFAERVLQEQAVDSNMSAAANTSRPRCKPEELRSYRWLGPDDLRSFGHRSRQKQAGYNTEEFTGKPVIGILNTWNDLISCHAHFKQRVEDVKRGVWQAVGFQSRFR